MAEVRKQHLSAPLPFEKLNGIAAPVVKLLGRMLEKAPGNRPQAPSDLRREIDDCIEQISSGESETERRARAGRISKQSSHRPH